MNEMRGTRITAATYGALVTRRGCASFGTRVGKNGTSSANIAHRRWPFGFAATEITSQDSWTIRSSWKTVTHNWRCMMFPTRPNCAA